MSLRFLSSVTSLRKKTFRKQRKVPGIDPGSLNKPPCDKGGVLGVSSDHEARLKNRRAGHRVATLNATRTTKGEKDIKDLLDVKARRGHKRDASDCVNTLFLERIE